MILLVGIVSAFSFVSPIKLDFTNNPWTFKQQYLRSSNFSGENLTADYFFGNGSQLTGLTESQITDLQTYLINNTAGWTANFTNIYSLDWTNVSITESQISNLVHTTDTTKTTRFDALVLTDCSAGNLVIGIQSDGAVLCATDAGGIWTNVSGTATFVGDANVTGDIFSNDFQVISYNRTVSTKNVTMTAVI